MTGLRALVVDDDPAVAALHERFLLGYPGFHCIGIATTGPDALARILESRPDVVLLDLHLPGYSGLEVLRQVRAARTAQPEIIAVTAARDVDSVREARRAGVRHYLVKPFSGADLHARLRDIATERATEASNRSQPLDQRAVDAFMHPEIRTVPLPKGLSRETLDRVLASLDARTEASAAEVGADLGLSRVACRRYLEHLVADARAERTLDYATSGRPAVRYRTRSAADNGRPES